MTTIRIRALIAALLLALAALTLTACGDDAEPPLLVSSSADPQMRAAAAVYAVALTRAGSPAHLDAQTGTDAELMEALSVGELDLFPAYSAELLAMLSSTPTATSGEELAIEVARALPQGVAVGDPTAARDEQRQELVPVYRSAALDRSALKALGRVAGELSSSELATLGERIERGEDPRAVAGQWVAARGI